MNPKVPTAEDTTPPEESHPRHRSTTGSTSLPKSERGEVEREQERRAGVPPAFRQLHELERLQSERIEQLFHLLAADREETLATVREMHSTMQVAQEMMGQADEAISNLGQAVAALVKLAGTLERLIAALEA